MKNACLKVRFIYGALDGELGQEQGLVDGHGPSGLGGVVERGKRWVLPRFPRVARPSAYRRVGSHRQRAQTHRLQTSNRTHGKCPKIEWREVVWLSACVESSQNRRLRSPSYRPSIRLTSAWTRIHHLKDNSFFRTLFRKLKREFLVNVPPKMWRRV